MSVRVEICFHNAHGSLITIGLSEDEEGRPEPVIAIKPANGDDEGFMSLGDMELCQRAAMVLMSGQVS